MNLIGSKTEDEMRNELLKSHKGLFQDSQENKLLGVLKRFFPEMKTAYVLNWTPEQGEDFYCVLINTDIIAQLEIDRIDLNADPIVEKNSISDYKRGLKNIWQIQLAVAIELARKDLLNQGNV